MILPIQWIIAIFFAALIHELGHLALLKLFRISIYSVQVGIAGAVIQTGSMEPMQEILCSLAGPIAGSLTLITARRYPLLFLCALGQTIFNLLPFPGADGERALKCLIQMLVPDRWQNKVKYIVLASAILLLVYVFAACLLAYDLSILLLPGLLLLVGKWTCQKNSCKDSIHNVQ